MAKTKSLSLVSQGLNYKLRIAFYLMSILPLMVSLYLISNYILPNIGIKMDIAISVIISIFIAVTGYFLVKQVINRILAINSEAKLILAGDINRKVQTGCEDEVGDLGGALNQLTARIRNNMEELKTYSERTTEINLEIQKRVIVLSNLLQISSLISQGAKLDDILKITIEKSRLLANSEVAYLLFRQNTQETFYMRIADGIDSERLLKIKIEPYEELFERFTKSNRPFIFDKENTSKDNLRTEFYDKFNLVNTLALPVFLNGRMLAIFGIGNSLEPFLYKNDDVELLDIFAKQVAIAFENDILMRRVEELEIKDALTGLYNEMFIRNYLQDEIKRAITYQRPCSFILLKIDKFQEFRKRFGSLHAEGALKKMASLIRCSVTEIQRVARFDDDKFAVVLPESNKRQALEIAQNLRKKIEFSSSEEPDVQKRLVISIGVSENPLDGVEAEELITKAKVMFKGITLEESKIAG